MLALNQKQPLGNSRFYAEIEDMTGRRREAKPRGRPYAQDKTVMTRKRDKEIWKYEPNAENNSSLTPLARLRSRKGSLVSII
ncbi:MAG TPA: hypothetical protein PK372_04655 [Rugosibacter sp.]|nr:hypothetical protein [Rugosibacter sp.]